ncbi:MAG: cyclin-like protein [Monoraphidium minutum]|nr:MAG: cyclin-like protein [Monoraphidium minutum]
MACEVPQGLQKHTIMCLSSGESDYSCASLARFGHDLPSLHREGSCESGCALAEAARAAPAPGSYAPACAAPPPGPAHGACAADAVRQPGAPPLAAGCGSGGPPAASLLCAETDAAGGAAPYGGGGGHAAHGGGERQDVPLACSSSSYVAGLDLEQMIRSHREREQEMRPDPSYLEAHAALAAATGDVLTPQMRMIVVSWMAEVAEEFALQPETLHLSVALLDRFLSTAAPAGVPRGVLQMVAVACIMVAAKDLEVTHPTVAQLTAIAANCFTPHDLLRMERLLLDGLGFGLGAATAFSALHLLAQGLARLPAPAAALAVYLLVGGFAAGRRFEGWFLLPKGG